MLKQLLNTKVISLIIAGFLLLRGLIQFAESQFLLFGLILLTAMVISLIWFPTWIEQHVLKYLITSPLEDTNQPKRIMLVGWFCLLAMLGVCVAFVPDQSPELLEELPPKASVVPQANSSPDHNTKP